MALPTHGLIIATAMISLFLQAALASARPEKAAGVNSRSRVPDARR